MGRAGGAPGLPRAGGGGGKGGGGGGGGAGPPWRGGARGGGGGGGGAAGGRGGRPPVPVDGGAGCRVLVVDDNRDAVDTLAQGMLFESQAKFDRMQAFLDRKKK